MQDVKMTATVERERERERERELHFTKSGFCSTTSHN